MPNYTAMDFAVSSCADMQTVVERLGLEFVSVPAEPFGAALAVRRPNPFSQRDNIVVIFVSADGSAPSSAVLASGVCHSVRADPNDVLLACNALNQWHPVSCVAYPGRDGVDVLLKDSLPPAILMEVPPFFRATLFDVADRVDEANSLLESRALNGTPYRWADDDLRQLVAHLGMWK